MNKWNYTLNIKQHIGNGTSNEDIVKAAQGVVAELKKLPVGWFQVLHSTFDNEVDDLLHMFEGIANDTSEEGDEDLLYEFNGYLGELYDWADDKKVWLGLK